MFEFIKRKSLFLNPRLIIIGCLRPSVQFSLLKKAKRFPIISLYLIQNIVLGWLVEPFYWIQKTVYKRPKNMPDPIFIIGSWRSGTTYLIQKLKPQMQQQLKTPFLAASGCINI